MPMYDSYGCGAYTPPFRRWNYGSLYRLCPKSKDSKLVYKALYLTRPSSTNRRNILNQDEILTEINSYIQKPRRFFGPKGHFTAKFEILDFPDPGKNYVNDRKLFNQVDIIFGVHGGAFSNLPAARRGTIVVEANIPYVIGQHTRYMFGYMSNSLSQWYNLYPLDREERFHSQDLSKFYNVPLSINASAFVDFVFEHVFVKFLREKCNGFRPFHV